MERRVCTRCDAAEERAIPVQGTEDESCCRRIKRVILDWIADYFRTILEVFTAMFSSVCRRNTA